MNSKNDIVDTLRKEWAKEKPELDTSAMDIVGRIMMLGEHYQKNINIVLKKCGLGYTDFDVLATIRRSGSPYALRPADLLNSILIQSGSLTSCIDRLEKASLVTREKVEGDRRSLCVKLTNKGIKLIDKVASERFTEAHTHIEHLLHSEKDTLIKLLKRLYT